MPLSPHNQQVVDHAQYLANVGLIPLLLPGINFVPREDGRYHPVCQCYRGEVCENIGKHPLQSWRKLGFDTPEIGLSALKDYANKANQKTFTFNLGIRTGGVSGVFAIDIDKKVDGTDGTQNFVAFLKDKQINDPIFYQTLTAQTGGDGRHYIYRYPKNGDVITNAAPHPAFNYGLNPRNTEESAVDVRGEGGILVTWPSIHKSRADWIRKEGPDTKKGLYLWLNNPETSIREDTPEAILQAVVKKQVSRDPGADYTPDLEDLLALAERLIRDKKRPTNLALGRDMKDALEGKPICLEGAAHEVFKKITYRIAIEWPRASAPVLMDFLADSVAARVELKPMGSCTHDDVFQALSGALVKRREEADHWEHKLDRSKEGKASSCEKNALYTLRNDPLWHGVFASNARSGRPYVLLHPPGLILGDVDANKYPRPLTDIDILHVVVRLTERLNCPIRKEHVSGAIRVICAEKAFDPFLDYLNALPPWDGLGRVDTWLQVLGGAEDTPINREFGRIWLLQAVYRTLEPGCQADYTLILEGSQGIGKSSLLRALVPDLSLFDDGLKPIDHSAGKDNLMKLGGPALLELAELGALRKGDIEAIKAFLTAREDTYRTPYVDHVATHKRRCVFAGTTNSDQYLRDSTGNRRFLPVRLANQKVNIGLVVAHRDQIWAEALLRARHREPAFMPPELEAAADEAQKARKMVEPWQEIVETWLDEAWAAIRKLRYHELSTADQDELGPKNVVNEVEEDPDTIASMFWLDKYDTESPKQVWDIENERRYGTEEHFSVEDLFEHLDIAEDRRTPSARDSIRNVLFSLGYEWVKVRKRGKHYNKRRWLRKNPNNA
jgi:predicted P-loop ATPase